MRELTAAGHSVEEAVQAALTDLNVRKDEVDISIIDEGKKGFFGIFGKKPAIVKVSVIANPIEEARKFLADVIEKMKVIATITVEQESKSATFNIEGEKIALLIGKRGQTLNSLQYLTQLVANRYATHYLQINVDAENYRERRKTTLSQLAQRLAHQAIRTSGEVSLEPMPSYERKIIHAELTKIRGIKTYSVGEEPNRHIVITPK
ncbi:RNA-binding cell elongation regulator Jag/EloR [Metabacillus herbersteinensis]|uniref:RNA-binding protein KhpB n=1 Tax=Metabacillus herbersteinensis TaxID=283816 RepID=A0ABV6GHA1_9BACI